MQNLSVRLQVPSKQRVSNSPLFFTSAGLFSYIAFQEPTQILQLLNDKSPSYRARANSLFPIKVTPQVECWLGEVGLGLSGNVDFSGVHWIPVDSGEIYGGGKILSFLQFLFHYQLWYNRISICCHLNFISIISTSFCSTKSWPEIWKLCIHFHAYWWKVSQL